MSQIAARPDAQTARAYWTMGRGDSERAFHAAHSHSRKVRVLRVAVPAAVLLFLGGFFAWTWFNPMRLLAGVEIGGDTVISGTKITMQAPRLTGFTRDARPYELSAKAAEQNLGQPDIVELRDLHAKFQMQDKSSAEVLARDGVYDSKKEILDLGENTLVTSSSGYRVKLDHPKIDIGKNQMITERPVQVETAQGQINAQRMEVLEAGELVRFDGVKMTIKATDQAGAGARQ